MVSERTKTTGIVVAVVIVSLETLYLFSGKGLTCEKCEKIFPLNNSGCVNRTDPPSTHSTHSSISVHHFDASEEKSDASEEKSDASAKNPYGFNRLPRNYSAHMYDGGLWWTVNNTQYASEPFIEQGWFPEREYDGDLAPARAAANLSFFRYCLINEYEKRWRKDPHSVLIDLRKWIMLDPVDGFDRNCLPPSLQDPATIDCQKHFPNAGFSEKKRTKPRKIGVAIQYGFEIDVLEMHLMEVYDVVDKFFITESIHVHKKGDTSSKYLTWEHLKWTPRFSRFADKVVYFALDDSLFPRTAGDGPLFANEHDQESVRFFRFLEWNKRNKFFDDDDMISFGDTDEIPSRHVIHALKYCNPERSDSSIDVGTFFLNKRVSAPFKTGFCVPGHEYNLGDPTFFTVGHCKQLAEQGQVATRQRGTSGHFMLGGSHCTYYPYLPQYLLKEFSCTECSGSMDYVTPFLDESKPFIETLKQVTDRIAAFVGEKDVRGQFKDGSEYYPWVLRCNPLRYKSFALYKPDDRLFLTLEELPFDSC